jgi:ATP-dependent helicase/nuclease subunit A
LWPELQGDFGRAAPIAMENRADPVADISQFVPQLKRLEMVAIPAALVKTAVLYDGLQANVEAAAGDAAYDGSYLLEKDAGILAHRYVELIAEQGMQSWDAARVQGLQPAMHRWLMRRGHSEKDAAQGAKNVTAALCATLASEQGRWILQARNDAANEIALETINGVNIASHVIDRTFTENGERWIIDYKSAELDASLTVDGLGAQAEYYRPQLERYAALFAAEGLPVRKAVFFLGLGKLVELS